MSTPDKNNYSLLLKYNNSFFVKDGAPGDIIDSGVSQLADGTWEIKTGLFRSWQDVLPDESQGNDGAAQNGYQYELDGQYYHLLYAIQPGGIYNSKKRDTIQLIFSIN